MKIKIIAFVMIAGLMVGTGYSQNQETIKVTPLPTPEGEFGYIGFTITAPWMDGNLLVRFPETLEGGGGMYFIDHDRPDMPPISKMESYPEWEVNHSAGEISYSYTTREGVEFGGYVNTNDVEIHMEFYVKNHTDKPVERITPRICLGLRNSNDFNQLGVTSDVFIWSGGEYFSLGKSTPTSEEIGREPLLVISREGFSQYKPGTDLGQWWVIDQTSDEDIIVRESKDKKHLVATSWPGDVSSLIYNSLIPCIHAGPTIGYTIDPGRERHWYGTIYLMENNPQKLFELYKSGKRYN